VQAKFLHSGFTASGKVVRVPDHGHDIDLDVEMTDARIEDLLALGVKTDPPVLTGPVELQTKLSLPPGPGDVANRLGLAGTFKIHGALFSNEKIQGRIDSLSLRSRGEPKLAQEHAETGIRSELAGDFRLSQGVFTFSHLQFLVPGAHADVAGQYSVDGNDFDFHGTLRLDARLSQMTTGWKSILLKPVDPFFTKNGAGTEIPFRVSGTRSEPHFGLDSRHDKSAPAGEQASGNPKSR